MERGAGGAGRLLTCTAVRWVSDEPWPGWVEVQLTDADGQQWSFFDKAPVFDAGDVLTPDAAYPLEVALECQVTHETTRPGGGQVLSVQMRWCNGVPTRPDQDPYPQDGTAHFQVRPDQLRPA